MGHVISPQDLFAKLLLFDKRLFDVWKFAKSKINFYLSPNFVAAIPEFRTFRIIASLKKENFNFS